MKLLMEHLGIIKEKGSGYVLTGNKCKACGRISYPKKPVCIACGCEDVEEVELGTKGKVYSYSTTMRQVSKLPAPCTFAYIDMPEGVRLFAPMMLEEGQEPVIGEDAELVFCNLWEEDGEDVLGYRFKQEKK